MRNGASCPTVSMAPVLAITSLVQGSGCSRYFDPVGEFLKPFVTGPNRIPISSKENRDAYGQKLEGSTSDRGPTGVDLATGAESFSRQLEQWAALSRTDILQCIPTFAPFAQVLLFGSRTPACPLPSKATRVSHGPDEIHEYAFVVVLQIGQVVGEVGEVVANAGLQVLGNMTIDRGQHAAAALTYIR
jgi:hypothetical protein